MISLYKHQQCNVKFLVERPSAMLANEMGTGKSRAALVAAKQLYDLPHNAAKRIDRVLVLAPASVCYAWREELSKLSAEGFNHNLLRYDPKRQTMLVEQVGGNLNGGPRQHMPVAIISYALLQQKRHSEAVQRWCAAGRTVLICDESSFLKSRTAKQTKGTHEIARSCRFRWLLSGTPVCNSPLDLYSQARVMSPNGRGPLAGIENFYQFQAMFGDMVPVFGRNGKPLMVASRRGRVAVKHWVADESRLVGLQKRFAPYVSRVEKKDCLDLPPKSYTVREVALKDETWAIYQELKRECMLALPESEARPEPNAAVRILRLCQLTSGHVGGLEWSQITGPSEITIERDTNKDVNSEKLDYLSDAILNGELANERAIIIWCRWRRERERLGEILLKNESIDPYHLYGGQTQNERTEALIHFQDGRCRRRVLLAQPHAGGFGLNLTAASTAVYLSNDWSFSTRVQSEDRCHRIGQTKPVLYVDIIATGPKGQRTVDHAILEALRQKQNVAEWTVSAWREALENE